MNQKTQSGLQSTLPTHNIDDQSVIWDEPFILPFSQQYNTIQYSTIHQRQFLPFCIEKMYDIASVGCDPHLPEQPPKLGASHLRSLESFALPPQTIVEWEGCKKYRLMEILQRASDWCPDQGKPLAKRSCSNHHCILQFCVIMD